MIHQAHLVSFRIKWTRIQAPRTEPFPDHWLNGNAISSSKSRGDHCVGAGVLEAETCNHNIKSTSIQCRTATCLKCTSQEHHRSRRRLLERKALRQIHIAEYRRLLFRNLTNFGNLLGHRNPRSLGPRHTHLRESQPEYYYRSQLSRTSLNNPRLVRYSGCSRCHPPQSIVSRLHGM